MHLVEVEIQTEIGFENTKRNLVAEVEGKLKKI